MRLFDNSIPSRKTSRDFQVFAFFCLKFGAFLFLGESFNKSAMLNYLELGL
jgi:hypothetical protein